jgi:predicted transcriptional regulator
MASSEDNAEFVEQAAVVDDIRVAEEQVAHGEFVEHDDAKQQVLARLGL